MLLGKYCGAISGVSMNPHIVRRLGQRCPDLQVHSFSRQLFFVCSGYDSVASVLGTFLSENKLPLFPQCTEMPHLWNNNVEVNISQAHMPAHMYTYTYPYTHMHTYTSLRWVLRCWPKLNNLDVSLNGGIGGQVICTVISHYQFNMVFCLAVVLH